MQVFIFSDEINSGKTTSLQKWATNNPKIGGILSPKINGERYFLSLSNQEKRKMESPNGDLAIGRFLFDASSFQWAIDEFKKQSIQDYDLLVLDEIGPLETKHQQGFCHFLREIIHEKPIDKDILLVVRSSMVEEVIRVFDIPFPTIISTRQLFFHASTINGLVLSGGKSKRMGHDKALIQYKNLPQWKNVEQLLKPFCNTVQVSVNSTQYSTWGKIEAEKMLVDDEAQKNIGPLTGIITYIKTNPNNTVFIVGIDYPLLKTEHLLKLNNDRFNGYDAICFQKNNQIEPLVCIVESNAFPSVMDYVEKGGESLKELLSMLKTKRIDVGDQDFLINCNTPKEYQIILNQNFKKLD